MHIVAMEVHIPLAPDVGKVNPLTGLQHIEAGSRHGLVKKIAGIFLQIMESLFMPNAIKPFFPRWRKVNVTLHPRCRIIHTQRSINKTFCCHKGTKTRRKFKSYEKQKSTAFVSLCLRACAP